MAARFRKIGITAAGACAGVAVATWALNPFDRMPQRVSIKPFQAFLLFILKISLSFNL